MLVMFLLLCTQTLVIAGTDPATVLQKGFDHALAGRLSDARSAFQLAIDLDPEGLSAREAHQQLAQLHFEEYKGGNTSARSDTERHYARYFEMNIPRTLLQWYNFHGSWEELKRKLGQESEAIATSTIGDFDSRMLLTRLVDLLRRKESNPQWLASHFVGCHILVQEMGLESPEACAYGTTWLQSFLAVLNVPAIQNFLKGAAPHVVVLGSALGYQCSWMAALVPSMTCVGYDLLCGLVDDAQRIWEEAAEGDAERLKQVAFVCRDALGLEPWWSASIEDSTRQPTGLLIWANDYTWGTAARRKLLAKVAQEAEGKRFPSILVVPSTRVDETTNTVDLPLEQTLSPAIGWRPAARMEIAASWHESLPLAVFERGIPESATAYTSESGMHADEI